MPPRAIGFSRAGARRHEYDERFAFCGLWPLNDILAGCTARPIPLATYFYTCLVGFLYFSSWLCWAIDLGLFKNRNPMKSVTGNAAVERRLVFAGNCCIRRTAFGRWIGEKKSVGARPPSS